MTSGRRLADVRFRALSRFHHAVLVVTGWRVAARVAGMQIVELHVVGRRSGRPRMVVLSAPIAEPARIVLVASRGGDDRHPEWYRNLVVHPEVDLTVGGRTRAMIARTAVGDERAELWRRVVGAYRGYEAYQRRTNRQIPVVVCEPREPSRPE